MSEILVVGEALVDIVSTADGPAREHPGGSPANVALGLARLGRRTALLTRIGDDERGRTIREHLEADGVRLVDGSITADPTSTARATVDPLGVASYRFDLRWELPDGAGTGAARALHTGSIAAFLPPGGDDLLRLVEQVRGEVVISYDPNARPQLMGTPEQARERVERLVAAADVVKVSDEDLAWLAPGDAPEEMAQRWLELGPAVVVVTRGGRGAFGFVRGGGTGAVPRLPVEVVDTVGAGDAFMSGLLDAIAAAGLLDPDRRADLRALEPGRLTGMLAHAGRVAAWTCTRAGAQPPTAAELAAWPVGA